MFKRIVLPLDGSDAAEAVIPYGEEMARNMGSSLVLFHACDGSHKQARGMHQLYLEKLTEIVRQNLNRGSAGGFNVTAEHRMGDFTTSLCDYIENNGADLVIMVAHGFTSHGTKSIADDVARLAKCPTLLVRHQRQPGEDRVSIRRLLIPLDGTPYSQQVLSIAKPMAEKFGAEIVLFSAAKASGHSAEDIESQKQALESYLKGVTSLLNGLNVSVKVGEANDFAVAIDEAAYQVKADMVMMVTNSRVTEWAENSISRKILNKGATSLLIMHRR